MLLQEEGDGLRLSVNEGPKGNFVDRILREGSPRVPQQTHMLPASEGKERDGGEDEPQMVAFAHPALEVERIGGTPGEQLVTQTGDFPPALVRYVEG